MLASFLEIASICSAVKAASALKWDTVSSLGSRADGLEISRAGSANLCRGGNGFGKTAQLYRCLTFCAGVWPRFLTTHSILPTALGRTPPTVFGMTAR